MLLKRVIVAVVGGTILLFGFALLVLPGPAFLVIPLGLAILATEFVWARRWLKRAKGMVDKRKAKRTTRALKVTCLRCLGRWRQRAHACWPTHPANPPAPPRPTRGSHSHAPETGEPHPTSVAGPRPPTGAVRQSLTGTPSNSAGVQ
jgi:hypothetical protein